MRAFSDRNQIGAIIEGGAKGADSMAREWAKVYDIPLETYRADWVQYLRRAGPIRNQRMVDEAKPHCVIAFPGGAGTDDMKRRARRAGILVLDAPFQWKED